MKKTDLLILLGFILGIHLLYFPTVGAGFVRDFTGLQEKLEFASFWGFLDCFGFPALEQINNFFLFIIYKSFGKSGLPWYLIFTSLHIANGFLFFKIGEKTLNQFTVANARLLSLGAAILFLFSPYASEVLVWRSCFNFLISTLFILLTLWHLLNYLEFKEKRFLWWMHFFFLIAIFTYELALILPFLNVFFLLFLVKKEYLRATIAKVFLPQLAALAAYFSLSKVWLGKWIGHYGAEVHLNIEPVQIFGNAYKYLLKYVTFLRDWEHLYKEKAVRLLEVDAVVWGITVVLGVLLIVALKNFSRLSQKWKASGLFLFGFFIGLSLISNLYFGWIQWIENDRYGYLASGFFFLLLMTLSSFIPKKGGLVVFLLYFICSLHFLSKVNDFWKKGTDIYDSLLADYRWEEEEKVYVLACPDNFEGTYLFKDYSRESEAVKDALEYSAGKKTAGKILQVAQFNMVEKTDGVSVKVDSPQQITVKFNQWGNWLWRNGIGASNYSNEEFKFRKIDKGYRLIFNDSIPSKGIFIYSDGGKWKEVELP